MSDTESLSVVRPELLQIAEAVARDKSIEQSLVIEAMEQAIESAAKKKYGQELEVKALIDKTSGEIKISRVLEVVESVENSSLQITIEQGKLIQENANIGDLIYDGFLRENKLSTIDIKSIEFENYLKTIVKQIKQIEGLVNEFSDFARMPKPIFQKNNLIKILENNITLLQQLDSDILISLKKNEKEIDINCDADQLNRVFLNIIKNSIESIQEKALKNNNFRKIINIVIKSNSDYINLIINDNGAGFKNKTINSVAKPYYTTKSKGTGLGLSIVSKIINDHNGNINFKNHIDGATVEINLPFKK